MRVEWMGAKEGFKKGQISPGVLTALIIIVLVLIVGAIVYVVVSGPENVATSSGVTITNPTGEIQTSAGVADPIFKQCQDACDSGNKILFCDFTRRFNNLEVTCNDLATNSQYSSYNVQTCPAIDCNPAQTQEQIADTTTCTALSGNWTTPASDGKCPLKDGKFVRERAASDNPPIAGQICC